MFHERSKEHERYLLHVLSQAVIVAATQDSKSWKNWLQLFQPRKAVSEPAQTTAQTAFSMFKSLIPMLSDKQTGGDSK